MGQQGNRTNHPSQIKQFCKNGHDTFATGKTKGRLKHDFGINLARYNELFFLQNGLCKICYRHQSQLKRKLNVDHCHKTSRIRALLCDDCNKALGFAKDNPDMLRKMADYLESF